MIAGRDVTTLPPRKRGVAMVFQSYALFPHLSVAENIMFGLNVRDVSRAANATRGCERAAELLGLEQLLDRKPSQLSGGQQQRVALGRAIVAEAPVCLMDEPLSNLDAQLRSEMRREIRALQRRLGITMVYVTHDQVEAMTMADRVVLMRAGRIEQNGVAGRALRAPADHLRGALRRHAADERAAGRRRWPDAARSRPDARRNATCDNGSSACVPKHAARRDRRASRGSWRSSISAPIARSRRGSARAARHRSRTPGDARRGAGRVRLHLAWDASSTQHWFDAASNVASRQH